MWIPRPIIRYSSHDGIHNNGEMAATSPLTFFVGLFFIMVIGSLSSTADSDLSALSALVMTDVYGKLYQRRVNLKLCSLLGALLWLRQP